MSAPKPLLFKPSNGKSYQISDYKYVCKQQPLPMEQLPEYLHTFDEGWTPPKLWLAWPSDLYSLLKCAEKAYPSEVIRVHGNEGPVVQTSIGALRDAVREEFVSDPDFYECVQIATVALPNGQHASALAQAVGCTHIGRLNANLIEKIQRLGYEEPPRWYIDPHFWMWRKQRAFVFPSFMMYALTTI